MPEITVLMPVYNASEYIRETIDSVLNQTFKDFEFLIINDGSTDNSEEIIKTYSDPRIRLVNNEKNMRLIATLNRGIDLAEGKYIARMDADDICLPTRLEKQYKVMEENPDIALCGTGIKMMGKKFFQPLVMTDPKQIRNVMRVFNVFFHPTIMFRKNILIENEYRYDPRYLHAEDYQLFQLMSEKHKLTNIDETLLLYRLSPGGISRVHNTEQQTMTYTITTEALKRIGINFDRNQYADRYLTKEQILEIKDTLEQIYRVEALHNEEIKDVLNWLWLDLSNRGSHHGVWMLKTYKALELIDTKRLNKAMVNKFYLKCLLKK
ncbi:glycosyltransferase family 2 protein [Neobacillus sp. NPDC097160]|uniref:glycosyltransferase family 2 protein n=1 Tax=Neobacillus sp. NPDC097160 TaxID=3364298 RepID=UPI00381A4B9B